MLGNGVALVSVDGSIEHTERPPLRWPPSAPSSTWPAAWSPVPRRYRACWAARCGVATVGDVLNEVVVHKPAATWTLVPGVFDPDLLLGRVQRLAVNLVRVAKPGLDLAELSLALVESPPVSGILGVRLIPKGRYPLGG